MKVQRSRTMMVAPLPAALLGGVFAGNAQADECSDRYYAANCHDYCGDNMYDYWMCYYCNEHANAEHAQSEVTNEYSWDNDYWEWEGSYCREVQTSWVHTDYQDKCSDGHAVGSPYSVETGTYFFPEWEYCGC